MMSVSSEMLLNIGIVIVGATMILSVICIVAFKLYKRKLKRQFDIEYGNYKNIKK